MHRAARVVLALALAGAVALGTAEAATKKKKKSYKRSDFTAEQREKLMEEARKICRKRYGSAAQVYRIDYARWMVICIE